MCSGAGYKQCTQSMFTYANNNNNNNNPIPLHLHPIFRNVSSQGAKELHKLTHPITAHLGISDKL